MVIRNSEWRKLETQRNLEFQIKKPMVKYIGKLYTEPREHPLYSTPKHIWQYIVVVIGLLMILWHIMRLPKPTKEATPFHNTRVILDIGERFKGYYVNRNRGEAVNALIHWVARLYDSSEYKSLLDVAVELIFREGWERRPALHPSPDLWREPLPYGGFHPFTDEVQEYPDNNCNDLRNWIKKEE